MAEPLATWRLEGEMGYLHCGPLHVGVMLNQLGAGLVQPKWSGKDCSRFSVLQLRPPLVASQPARTLVDSYVRGTDLVATFDSQGPAEVAPQIYWRAKQESTLSAAGVEVVISMRTDLLDCEPHSAVDSVGFESRLFHSTASDARLFQPLTAATEKRRLERDDANFHLFLFRSAAIGLSYAEMVHPSDFEAAEIDYRGEPNGEYRIRSYLFPEHLEKGVIRRGRVCGWFMPSENDLETAVALARQFVDEPLPLTA